MDAHPQTPPNRGGLSLKGERSSRIEGSFRRISVHQLTLAWWLHRSGHMTRRQLRVYFAAHELAERRRYTSPEHRGAKPLFTLDELARLVGGRGDPKALRELRADVRALRGLGLVSISKHAITFAVSADQVTVDDISGFWSIFNEMPNRRRSVPVPRRLLRALAAGFSRAVTALIIAVLIRGLFWHKQSKDYRTDGRYKLSWVAEHFGISRRAATDARTRLIDLGWSEPLEVNQWEMNAWGVRDRIVPEWSHTAPTTSKTEAVGGSALEGCAAESATQNRDFAPQSASPDLTDTLSLTGDQKTRRLPSRVRSGVSRGSTLGSRKKKNTRRAGDEPNIRDIQADDLGNVSRLLELHQQAIALGLASGSEAGRLDFMALAQRARCRGKRAGALFYWLLRERKQAFITHADEEDAARLLREHYNGPRGREREQRGGAAPESRPPVPDWTEDDRTVMACLRVAQQRRLDDPFRAAQIAKRWTRHQWDQAHASYEQKKYQRWSHDEMRASTART